MQSPRYVAKYGAIRFLSCPGRAAIVSKFRAVSGTACKMPSPTPPKSAKVELSPACTGVSQEGEGMKNDLFSWTSIVKLALFLLPATLAASAQTVPRDHPSTDAEKIADALRAGPRFITKDATLLDWPTTAGGEYRVLRQGTNQ